MCPSWGGRAAGGVEGKAGLAYTLMGRADAGEGGGGCLCLRLCEQPCASYTCEAAASDCSYP